MKCSFCGAELGEQEKFCPECGKKVETQTVRFCRECGSELKEGTRFCTNCGAEIGKLENGNLIQQASDLNSFPNRSLPLTGTVPNLSSEKAPATGTVPNDMNQGTIVDLGHIASSAGKTRNQKKRIEIPAVLMQPNNTKKGGVNQDNKKRIVVAVAAFLVLLIGLGGLNKNSSTSGNSSPEPQTTTSSPSIFHSHEWTEATCTSPKTCKECGATQGDPLGHDFSMATCSKPMVCSRCGVERGAVNPNNHHVLEWTITEESTCSTAGVQEGKCEYCGEIITKAAPLAPHVPGETVIAVQATIDTPGRKDIICSVCGEVCGSERYSLSEEEIEAAYKSNCESYSYKDIARYPDEYKGKYVKFRGEVVQVVKDTWGSGYTLRVDVTYNGYFWEDTIYVEYVPKDDSEARILEEDIITLYGICQGEKSYTSVLGSTITIPIVEAEYIDIE